MLLHQLMKVEQDTAPIQNRRRAPGRKCRLRRRYRGGYFLAGAKRNLGYRLPGCGIVLDEDLTARNLWLSIYENRTGLKLAGDCTARHMWALDEVRMLGRRDVLKQTQFASCQLSVVSCQLSVLIFSSALSFP